MSMASLTAVVVTWNSADVVGDLLDALAECSPPPHVVVVDNGSKDHTRSLVASHPSRPRLVTNGRNRGLAAANNQGLAGATGEFALICNPDTVPRAGAVAALLASAERHPRAAIVVARLVGPDGALQPGVGDLPTFGEAFRGRRAAHRARRLTGFWWDGWAHDEERQIGHGQEAFYLVRREALLDVGVQDEQYRLDWEGVDWSARVAAAGWEVWFCPDAEVLHLGGVSMSRARLRWVIGSHRGMYRYFANRGPLWQRVPLALLVLARGAFKTALLIRPDLYARGNEVTDVD
jgi:GT2 family glycosyltransferase